MLAFERRDGTCVTAVTRSDGDDIPRSLSHPVSVFVEKDDKAVDPENFDSAREFLASFGMRRNPGHVETVARRKGWEKVVTSYNGAHWVAARRGL